MDDREWACRWVLENDDSQVELRETRVHDLLLLSDADLAEAVRVKCVSTYPISIDEAPGDPWPGCVKAWGLEGPPGFFREVREVVDGR